MEAKVSLFKNAFSKVPMGKLELHDILLSIKNGSEFNYLIDRYRQTKERDDKVKIPCFTASGVFSKRLISEIETYNGVVCLDIDKKDNEHLDMHGLFEKLKTHSFIYAVHYSVGGSGLAVYIRTNNKQASYHPFVCDDYMSQFKRVIDVNCDKSCKDITRLRFLSYDADIYINDDSLIVPVDTAKYDVRKEVNYTANDVGAAINGTHPILRLSKRILENEIDITSDYGDWVKIAFSMADAIGESGRSVFHELSRMYPKYNFTETDKLYSRAMSRDAAQRVTERTFFKIASDYGIYLKEN